MPRLLSDITTRLSLTLLIATIFIGCGGKGSQKAEGTPDQRENLEAKRMLQGIWVDADNPEDIAFWAKGDTIYYPDTTSLPVRFQIIADTFVLRGANEAKYPIVRQTAHLFVFKNQNGDEVRLALSEDPSDSAAFVHSQNVAVNQGKLLKRDTVVMFDNQRYHLYVQVNPTSYKVIKPTYNDDGVEVDNVYYDNIVNLNVIKGSQKLFGQDFRKQRFAGLVPDNILSQCVLSDITFKSIDKSGLLFVATLAVPDSNISYLVSVRVSFDGKPSFSLL